MDEVSFTPITLPGGRIVYSMSHWQISETKEGVQRERVTHGLDRFGPRPGGYEE